MHRTERKIKIVCKYCQSDDTVQFDSCQTLYYYCKTCGLITKSPLATIPVKSIDVEHN